MGAGMTRTGHNREAWHAVVLLVPPGLGGKPPTTLTTLHPHLGPPLSALDYGGGCA